MKDDIDIFGFYYAYSLRSPTLNLLVKTDERETNHMKKKISNAKIKTMHSKNAIHRVMCMYVG